MGSTSDVNKKPFKSRLVFQDLSCGIPQGSVFVPHMFIKQEQITVTNVVALIRELSLTTLTSILKFMPLKICQQSKLVIVTMTKLFKNYI